MGIFATGNLEVLNEASKREVEDRIKRKSKTLFLHLLKLYYWGYDDNTRWYWIKEISKIYDKIPKLPNNKYPSKENIENLIWNDYDKNLKDLIKILNNDNNYDNYITIKNPDYNTIQFCKKYIEWLAEELSLYGTINERDAQLLLLKLYDEYKWK